MSSALRAAPAASPALYLGGFVVLGLMSNLAGPGLVALRTQVGASLGEIGLIFTAGSCGGLLGSLAGGRGFDRDLGHRLLGGAYLLAALALALLPWADSLAWLCLIFGTLGVCGGVIDVGCNTLLVWGNGGRRPVGSLLNALHLCFGIGALAAPAVVYASLERGGSLLAASLGLAGLALALGAVLWSRAAPPGLGAAADADKMTPQRVTERRRSLGLVVAGAGFFVLYVGLEVGFAGWIATYAEELRFGSAAIGAGLTTLFWGAFTLGRLASIGLARRWSPGSLMTASCVAAIAASALLLLAGTEGAPDGAMWLATACFGLAIAPQFPTMLAWAEAHMPFTARATGWFIAASALGGLLVPWTIGLLLERLGGPALPWTMLALAVAIAAWFAGTSRLARGAIG